MYQLQGDRIRNPDFRALFDDARAGLQSLDDIVGLVLLAYFAGFRDKPAVNHVLLEGLNGTAKTTVVKALTRALLGAELRRFYRITEWDSYVRVAGSPDQTPADLTGFDAPGYDAFTGRPRLVFTKGPLLQDKLVWYADELNRSPAKTQAVWLEPMAEGGNVTITSNDRDWRYRRTFRLPDFFLIASQNPETQEGTFPLPEAMLDRFLVKITMSYTTRLHRLVHEGEPSPPPPLSGEERAAEARKLLDDLAAAGPDSEGKPSFRDRLAEANRRAAGKGRPPVEWLPALADPDALAEVLARPIETKPAFRAAATLEQFLLAARRTELRRLKDEVRAVPFPREVAGYVARLVIDTWSRRGYAQAVGGTEEEVPLELDPGLANQVRDVTQGASPRAAIALRDLALARAWATEGLGAAATHAHVAAVAPFVLRHRISLSFQSAMDGASADGVVAAILAHRNSWVREGFGGPPAWWRDEA